jgi:hypothetical protein
VEDCKELHVPIVLSFTQRQWILFADQLKQPESSDATMDVDGDGDIDDDWEDEESTGLSILPPGKEGFLQSHAGGEAILHDILNDMTNL